MTNKEQCIVSGTVDAEGFDYAFRFYSNFLEIQDPKFHELREAYKQAAKNLIDYCKIGE